MKNITMAVLAATMTIGTLGLTACQTTPTTSASDTPVVAADSLYNRLGGETKIRTIAGAWVDAAAKDSRLSAGFANAKLDTLKQRMCAQMIELAGGPKAYMGKDMKTAHKGMNVSDAEWSAFLENLKTVLAAAKVGDVEQQQLLVIYQPMKRQVVGQ